MATIALAIKMPNGKYVYSKLYLETYTAIQAYALLAREYPTYYKARRLFKRSHDLTEINGHLMLQYDPYDQGDVQVKTYEEVLKSQVSPAIACIFEDGVWNYVYLLSGTSVAYHILNEADVDEFFESMGYTRLDPSAVKELQAGDYFRRKDSGNIYQLDGIDHDTGLYMTYQVFDEVSVKHHPDTPTFFIYHQQRSTTSKAPIVTSKNAFLYQAKRDVALNKLVTIYRRERDENN